MKIIPAIGMALVLEDKRDYGDTDLEIPEDSIRGVGTQGVIFAVTNDPDEKNQYKEKDHILFSKFNEQISVYENGRETLYYSIPVQSIIATIQDD